MFASDIHSNDNDNPDRPSDDHEVEPDDLQPAESKLWATYSPDDNKLRLYARERLDPATYERVREAGFIWAPRQEHFVAPAWSPERADLLGDLCGEIGDDDSSLVDRAELRAERFASYESRRSTEANDAREAVSAITDHIPLGQPILVGHHSERRARRDAERIEKGMRRAVHLWEAAEYWQRRAKSALQHAKYKERADVRYRRIKTLEAEVRRLEASFTPAPKVAPSTYEGKTMVWVGATARGGQWVEEATLPAIRERAQRWLDHLAKRLAYEHAMLGEQGGVATDHHDLAVGGRVLVRQEWLTIVRVNRSQGRIVSVTTNARYGRVKGVEEITAYEAPSEEAVQQVKAATKQPPLCNFPVDGALTITQDQWTAVYRDHKRSKLIKATDSHGAYRQREVDGFVARRLGYDGSVTQWSTVPVYLRDAKRVDPPPLGTDASPPARIPAPQTLTAPAPARERTHDDAAAFGALREQLKLGVRAVAAPQLFVTPPAIAQRMVALADPQLGDRLLEPSAGTGNLLRALPGCTPFGERRQWFLEVVAVEKDERLAAGLAVAGLANEVICCDFLACTDLGSFDVVLMNPPFVDAQDVAHIKHAHLMLKPGGRLVAICANGPRQHAALRSLVDACGGTWEELLEGSFASSGTDVRAVLLTLIR